MNERSSNIKKFWDMQAKRHGISHKASWQDYYCIQLEIDAMDKYIVESDVVLDIGCGNGISTIELASRKNIRIKGIDYSHDMILSAQENLAQRLKEVKGSASFEVGDVLDPGYGTESYSKVTSRRVLINLNGIDQQIETAGMIHKILRPDGYFLMSEATLGGLSRLNKLREEFGMRNLEQPWHNVYIDEEAFLDGVSNLFEVFDIVHFSSTYYIGSRILQPFIRTLLNKDVDYLSEINRLFSTIPSFGDYGVQKLFVLKKI